MSRFADDYDEYYPNQGQMWWANVERAISGKKGQRALRDLEEALLALPEKKLISGHLALDGQVCTMGALALKKKVDAGEDREEVLRALADKIPTSCLKCYHSQRVHNGDGDCSICDRKRAEGQTYSWLCTGYVPGDEDYEEDGALITAELGRDIGLTFTFAWHLAYVNDEYGRYEETPEERYERVLEWTRKVQVAA